MYDDLVKRLRDMATSDSNIKSNYIGLSLLQAADAIEELTRKYLDERNAAVELTGELASMPRWIPVTERLPEHQDEYLVLWKQKVPVTGRLFYEILEYEGENWVDDIPQAEPFGGFEVAFWQPLPDLPEEG